MRLGTPGQRLRKIREGLGLPLQEVEKRSRHIVDEYDNQKYLVTATRLSQIEIRESFPSIYKLATLSKIYGLPYTQLLKVYGIDTNANQPKSQDGTEQSSTILA